MWIIILFAIVVLTTGQKVSSNLAENVASVNHSEQSDKANDQSSESEKVLILDKDIQSKMENGLLTLFGIKNRPKPIDRTKMVIPDAMKSLFSKIDSEESNESVHLPKSGTDTANTVRSFVHEESEIDNRFMDNQRFRLFFNVSQIPKEEILKAANLELQRTSILGGTSVWHTVRVYDIIRPGIKGKTEPMLYLMDTKTVNINSSESVNLDVSPAVERWLTKPKRNYGVLIHIVVDRRTEQIPQQHIRLKRSAELEVDKWAKQQPILMTYTDDGRYKQRMINSPGQRPTNRAPNKRRARRQMCQRKALYVDFSSVGWGDWIVAPRGYDAFYCQGECNIPFADHLNSTNHAVVQAMVNSINSDVAPKACCIPTELKPISILYLDDHNKVVLKSYKDMQVVGCGCR